MQFLKQFLMDLFLFIAYLFASGPSENGPEGPGVNQTLTIILL